MIANANQLNEEIDFAWANMPLYIGYKDIMKMGFSKGTIYRWFNSENFPPMIRTGGYRVNKYKFKEWLEKYEVKQDED